MRYSYNHSAEERYLDRILAEELAMQDLDEEIDDRVFCEIEKLEAEGIELEDLDRFDLREIELRVIAEMQEERQQRLIDQQLDRYGYQEES